jgi:Fur family ferric uptake transcriptional regulator
VGSNLAELLRQRGLQVTAQRLAVFRTVSGQPHITADAVAEAVRSEIGAISHQAVYDALGVLVTARLIRRIQPAGSAARYEDRVGDNHHHLICRICGRVVDVECAVGAAPCLTAADDRGYEIDEAEVAYWGRCPDCLGQSSTSFRSRQRVRLTASAEAAAVKKADTPKVRLKADTTHAGAEASLRSHRQKARRTRQRILKRNPRAK